MMDRLTELLATTPEALAEMDDPTLAAHLAELEQAFEAASTEVLEAPSADGVQAITDAADAIDAARALTAARVEAAQALADQVQAARLRVVGPEDEEPEPEEDPEPQAVVEPPEVPEVPEDPEVPEVPAEEPIAVAAAARPARTPIAAVRVPAAHRARATAQGPRASLRAAADLPEAPAGGEFRDWREAAVATNNRLRDLHGSDGGRDGMRVRVGTLQYAGYEPDRVLTASMSPDQVDARVQGLQNTEGDSLVASGGLCAPGNVRYELETIAQADRPLRSGLPSFNASRGAITGNAPAQLVDIIVDNTGGAIDTITVADDEAAATKTIQEASCGAAYTVQVTAITERLKFSNWTDRFNPERMEQFQTLARAAHARRAEQFLLGQIAAGSLLINAGSVDVGASRQILGNLMVIASRYRVRHRMLETGTIRVILPLWIGDLVATDLLYQLPGDQTITDGVKGRAWITARLGDANIVPIWQRDDLDNTGMAAAQGVGVALDYPQSLTSFVFHEGAWLHLDGGQLDFGVVRDSTLNAVNRFETFFETFEAVAFVGVQSLRVVHSLVASGASGAAVTGIAGGIGS